MTTPTPTTTTVVETRQGPPWRATPYRPPRRRWPGLLAAGLVGAGIAAAVVSSWYDPRTLGQRLDASVVAAERGVAQQVAGLQTGAAAVAEKGSAAGEQVAGAFGDAAIAAAVKAALAVDPALSAITIQVDTRDGVVRLVGPAPDVEARERAGMLAAAPEGVRGVDNQLSVVSAPRS